MILFGPRSLQNSQLSKSQRHLQQLDQLLTP